tara:strand:- start:404 stop:649 length:246 start_codon:yes stop_codon:yes gene_type:complete
MKNKQEIKQRRDKIRNLSGKIVDLGAEISGLMENVPHPRGMVYRSLKPKSEEHIIHSDNATQISYRHTDGQLYEINLIKTK